MFACVAREGEGGWARECADLLCTGPAGLGDGRVAGQAMQGTSSSSINPPHSPSAHTPLELQLPARRPGYDKERDGPLPCLMWAYPREFKSKDAAGQLRRSPHQFSGIGASGPLLWLARRCVPRRRSLPPCAAIRQQAQASVPAAVCGGAHAEPANAGCCFRLALHCPCAAA